MTTITNLNRKPDGVFETLEAGDSKTKRNPVIDVTHPDYGAFDDGTNPTETANAIQSAFDDVATNGGVVFFPQPETHYLIDDRIRVDSGSAWVTVLSNGATIKVNGDTVAVQTRGNTVWNNLKIENDSGCDFGFRPVASGYNTIFNGCTANEFESDGWYWNESDDGLYLNNCHGELNGRWDVAAVDASMISVKGGEFLGNGTDSLGAIDIEPAGSGAHVKHVIFEDLRAEGDVTIVGTTNGDIETVRAHNITIDGTNGAKFRSRGSRYTKIGTIETVNGGEFVGVNNDEGKTAIAGRVEFIDPESTQNVLKDYNASLYNSLYGWDVSTGSGAILSRNVDVGPYKGTRVSNEGDTYAYARLNSIPVDSGTYYTVGAFIDNLETNATSSLSKGFIVKGFNDDGDNFAAIPDQSETAKWVTAYFKTGSTVSEIDIQFGESSSSIADLKFAHPFLIKGQVNVSELELSTEIIDNSAPSNGTWDIGDKIYKPSPSSGGNIGFVCTDSGTPGTWDEFGSIL